jgi:hypothetical protein
MPQPSSQAEESQSEKLLASSCNRNNYSNAGNHSNKVNMLTEVW